jgi:hypothetical protein
MGPSLRIGIPSGLPTIRELGISVENFQGPYRGRDAGGTRLFARYFGSWCVCTFQFDTISVQWFDFRSMNSVQVPGAVVLPLMTSGTSVLIYKKNKNPFRRRNAQIHHLASCVEASPGWKVRR